MDKYKAKATDVGTFSGDGPGLEGCAPIWDREEDATRCAIAMNNAAEASTNAAAAYLEARSQHFGKYGEDATLSLDARRRCFLQSQCLKSAAAEVKRGDLP